MKTLIVEDEYTSRTMLQKFLAPYGECMVAVDGQEAIAAYQDSLTDGAPFNLICLDLQMPNIDGHSTLKTIRAMEEKKGIDVLNGVKIIIITGLKDPKEILKSFKLGCEALVNKPIEKQKLLGEIKKLGLIS